MARPEKRKTTDAPMITPDQDVGGHDLEGEGRGEVADPGLGTDQRAADGVGVGAEQRRRGEHRRGDRDALGDGLGGVADGVELGEDLGALAVHVAGHLGDALRVVADRAEGVHGDDDADRGEQAAAGQRDEEQRHDDDAAAEQEGAVDGRADDQRGVDGGLEADPDAGQDDGGRAGQRGARDVDRRLLVGAGEVAGQPEDDAGEHDAEEDRADGDQRAGCGRARRRPDPPRSASRTLSGR